MSNGKRGKGILARSQKPEAGVAAMRWIFFAYRTPNPRTRGTFLQLSPGPVESPDPAPHTNRFLTLAGHPVADYFRLSLTNKPTSIVIRTSQLNGRAWYLVAFDH
ncbi:hypothetical protein PMIN06_001741 [Paraphaeosphaeria minitans]